MKQLDTLAQLEAEFSSNFKIDILRESVNLVSIANNIIYIEPEICEPQILNPISIFVLHFIISVQAHK